MVSFDALLSFSGSAYLRPEGQNQNNRSRCMAKLSFFSRAKRSHLAESLPLPLVLVVKSLLALASALSVLLLVKDAACGIPVTCATQKWY